jgi:hypothetical protein
MSDILSGGCAVQVRNDSWGSSMAKYDPSQPMWKRNVAGILDFLLALFIFGFLLNIIFGHQSHPPVLGPGVKTTEMFGLGPMPSLRLLALIIAYFVFLGRTGGTVFQRIFGMKRGKRPA